MSHSEGYVQVSASLNVVLPGVIVPRQPLGLPVELGFTGLHGLALRYNPGDLPCREAWMLEIPRTNSADRATEFMPSARPGELLAAVFAFGRLLFHVRPQDS
jgi:hypothetical protein